jgi:hypothetical protein
VWWGVGGIPAVLAAVGDPQASAVGAGKADDQVDVGVDGSPVVDVDGLVELELDRAVAVEVDLGVRVAARLHTRRDELNEQLDERLGALADALGVWAEGAELIEAAVDQDTAVGVLERLVVDAVGDRAGDVAGAGGLVLHRDREHKVAATLGLREDGEGYCDLLQDFLKDTVDRDPVAGRTGHKTGHRTSIA